jgi:hypothetical protein
MLHGLVRHILHLYVGTPDVFTIFLGKNKVQRPLKMKRARETLAPFGFFAAGGA